MMTRVLGFMIADFIIGESLVALNGSDKGVESIRGWNPAGIHLFQQWDFVQFARCFVQLWVTSQSPSQLRR
jgi:hypothetical protein